MKSSYTEAIFYSLAAPLVIPSDSVTYATSVSLDPIRFIFPTQVRYIIILTVIICLCAIDCITSQCSIFIGHTHFLYSQPFHSIMHTHASFQLCNTLSLEGPSTTRLEISITLIHTILASILYRTLHT